ncbi:arylsulfatase [Methylobacterium sp.]|uniref:arylsulfatase n=1 Tax=Methylobacterium sp. TaxID=409 RepID=UPI0025F7AEEB|nr:arylsulfatase [Methylobacterium sp.]MBY0257051.1 arylsulfatase [Methylobacterium sp.]
MTDPVPSITTSDETRSPGGIDRRSMLLTGTALVASIAGAGPSSAQVQQPAPPPQPAPVRTGTTGRPVNILVMFGDDIGQANVSAYTFGVMGYRTPHIDRIAREGMMFTDYYGEQSCTAGRSAFITGQSTLRTGLSKVGLPGATVGLQKEDPTLAELLKPLGYATGQFGKNHLGDRDEYLPTNHGFDEFFGNLYHLNAEEEPEQRAYPRDPAFRKKYGPRGVLRASADGTIEDTGPLTRKRMETIDDETSAAAMDFMERQVQANKPFFCWFNSTRMHFRTHVADSRRSAPGLTSRTEYADGMAEHDGHIGQLLQKLDALGIANDTVVLYTTDNGPHLNSWPDSAMTPFRNEKNSNWEGAFRVPCVIRWPGRIAAGSVSNEIVSALDWLPTLMAAVGDSEITEKLLKGHTAGARTFKVRLDGYNQLPYLMGQQDRGARKAFFYFNDDGDLVGMRYENWKVVFEEQRAPGTLRIWAEPFTRLRVPKLFDLRADPYERADITSNTYYDWLMSNVFVMVPAQAEVARFLDTFRDFPPRQRAASFSIDQILEKMRQAMDVPSR